jgi:DNA-binding NarL/FixJ family response regulator
VLTDSAEDRIVEAAKRGGAQGLATTSGTDVRGTISILKRVKMGEAAFPGPGPASKAAPPASSVPDPRPKPLADDERAFLSALATGKSNRMIAADLGLSEIAVKLEVRRLLREHQLGHRAQLVLLVKSLATAEGQG